MDEVPSHVSIRRCPVKRIAMFAVAFALIPGAVVFTADKPPVLIGLQGAITGPWAYEGQMGKQS